MKAVSTALALAAVAPAAATAGAWTLEPGALFYSANVGFFRSDGANPYEEISIAQYAEFGALPWLTLGGSLEAFQPVGDYADAKGRVEAGVFARARLETFSHGDPMSLQLGLIGDFFQADSLRSSGEPFANVEWAPNGHEIDARILYGRGFEGFLDGGWIDLQFGARIRGDDRPAQYRFDATAGLRLTEDWFVMVQSFNSFDLTKFGYYPNSDAGSKVGPFDSYKVAPSIGYRVNERTTLVLGAEREFVRGEKGEDAWRFRVGVWRNFGPRRVLVAPAPERVWP